MIDAGILDGDYVVARVDPSPVDGAIVVAGIPGEEATVKTLRREGAEVVLVAANPTLTDLRFAAEEVSVYGRVVTVLRKL